MNAVNMVRLGLATCEVGIMGPAKYKKNWEMKSIAEIKPLYERIMEYLKKRDFGEYLAMRELFGEEVAIRAGLRGQVKLPGFVSNEQRKAVREQS